MRLAGAHDERFDVPETCGVTHFDCWLSETGGLSGYSVVAKLGKPRSSQLGFSTAGSSVGVPRSRFALAISHQRTGHTHERSCLFTLWNFATSSFFLRERDFTDDNHGPPFLLQDLQGPP